jgi:hypothetical protein
MRRLFQTDYLLWAILSIAFFVTLAVIHYRTTKRRSWLGDLLNWADKGFADFEFNFVGFCIIGMVMFVPMVAVAWVAQAIFLRCGVRLTGGKQPDQAPDYRETPKPRN